MLKIEGNCAGLRAKSAHIVRHLPPPMEYKDLSRFDLSTINGTKNDVYSLAKKRLEGKGDNDKRFLKC